MMETQEDKNSLLEYLVTGTVILLFGGLYYFLNSGSSLNAGQTTQALTLDSTSPKTTSSWFSGSSGLNLTSSSDVANKNTTSSEASDSDLKAKANQAVISQNQSASKEVAQPVKLDGDIQDKANNVTATADNSATLKSEEIAALEAEKRQLENDILALKRDKDDLLKTNTELSQQADASVEQLAAANPADEVISYQ